MELIYKLLRDWKWSSVVAVVINKTVISGERGTFISKNVLVHTIMGSLSL